MNEINENLSPIPEEPFDLTVAKRSYSRIGLSLLTIFLVGTILQLLMAAIPPIIWGEDNFLTASSWGLWIITFVPIYVVAFPLGLLMLRKLPASTPAPQKIGAKRFLGYIPLCFFLMYAGNIIGIGLSSFFSGGTAENAILEYAMDSYRPTLKHMGWIVAGTLVHLLNREGITRLLGFTGDYMFFRSGMPVVIPGVPQFITLSVVGLIALVLLSLASDPAGSVSFLKSIWKKRV